MINIIKQIVKINIENIELNFRNENDEAKIANPLF